jgi:hypothetical protein
MTMKRSFILKAAGIVAGAAWLAQAAAPCTLAVISGRALADR